MMEDSFHHMFFLFLKKSIYVGATQNITFLKIFCTHWYIKHVIKNNMHLKHSNNNNSTSNIQCLIKHTMLLESRSKPGNQIIKADKKRINMLKKIQFHLFTYLKCLEIFDFRFEAKQFDFT